MPKQNEFRVIGKRLPNVEAFDKVTGAAKYTDDITLNRMLYGKVLRSPHPHAEIKNVDFSEAKTLPGVVDVIVGKDIPHNSRILGSTVNDQSVLTEDKVRFIGDAVAAVAATTPEIAEKALELIQVDYKVLPPLLTMKEAMSPDAPRIHDYAVKNVASVRKVRFGDIEEGFQEADHIFEGEFETQSQEHATLEPMSAIAQHDPRGELTVWTGTQTPYKEKAILSRAFGIPHHKIRVIVPAVGGGFGGKDVQMRVIYITVALAIKCSGQPVKIIYNREEDLVSDTIRHPTKIHLKTGLKKDGTITARQCTLYMNNGSYTHHGDLVCGAIGVVFAGVYKTPHLHYDSHLIYTNTPFGGPCRGFGNVQVTYAVESHMDDIANALGMDPVALRLKNAVVEGDSTARGTEVGRCALKECIQSAADAIGWEEKRSAKKQGRKVRGVGIACGNHWCGWRTGFDGNIWRTGFRDAEELYDENPGSEFLNVIDGRAGWRDHFQQPLYDSDASSCILNMNEDGTVVIQIGDPEIGQGVKTAMAMIAAEELGLGLEDIKVVGVDTDAGAFGIGSSSSRVTLVLGNAVVDAARMAKAALLKIAGGILEEAPKNLTIEDRWICSRSNPQKRIMVGDAAFRAFSQREGGELVFHGYHDPDSTIPDKKTGRGTISATWSYFAQAIEVEVDRETGDVEIINFKSAHDVGTLINPLGAEGQVEGASHQGIGYAFSEKLNWKHGGRIANPNLLNYRIPTPEQMCTIDSIFIESDDPKGPFGAKGLGEPASVPAAPAIGNAIENALGVRIGSLPFTPDKILKAINKE
ncbi:MAG: molybdopterin-dependent oxidoreductase [Deltaproteobacteria bacterium]|nr:molybdopterin-dependent oxidoreductase [Deltaproteobacteria bacterium]